MDSAGKEAGSQAAQMQSLAHGTNAGINRECGRLSNAVLGLPLEMSAVNSEHKRCTGCTNAVPVCGCLQGSPCRTLNGTDASKHKTVHGLLNAVSVCGCLQGSPRNLRDDPGAHGNERNGAMQTRASRHGVKAEAGRQGMARQGRQRPL